MSLTIYGGRLKVGRRHKLTEIKLGPSVILTGDDLRAIAEKHVSQSFPIIEVRDEAGEGVLCEINKRGTFEPWMPSFWAIPPSVNPEWIEDRQVEIARAWQELGDTQFSVPLRMSDVLTKIVLVAIARGQCEEIATCAGMVAGECPE